MYIHIVMPFIQMISLFRLKNLIGGCFKMFLVSLSISTVIYLLIYPLITLFCVISCSFCVSEHESVVPARSEPANMEIIEKKDLSKSHLGISRQKICEAQSQQQDFLLVGTDVILVVPNQTICPAVSSIYGYLQMQCLV